MAVDNYHPLGEYYGAVHVYDDDILVVAATAYLCPADVLKRLVEHPDIKRARRACADDQRQPDDLDQLRAEYVDRLAAAGFGCADDLCLAARDRLLDALGAARPAGDRG